jgi:hypothetical protein
MNSTSASQFGALRQGNQDLHAMDLQRSLHCVQDQERDKAVEEAAWASLCSKLETVTLVLSSDLPSSVLGRMFELFEQEASPPTTLSKFVLAVAPRLADDEYTVFEDPYLCETPKCKMAYASRKPFKNLIIKAQGRRMQEQQEQQEPNDCELHLETHYSRQIC